MGAVAIRRVLLLGADYYGTLAAARSYGRSGVPVAMADESRQARGLYSRYVKEKAVHPPLSNPSALIDWLVDWGKAHPDTLLYPPNDHLAWLFAAERERLSRVFAMFSPSEDAVIRLLDKKRLHEACAEVGIDVPVTHALGPEGIDSPVVSELTFPVLLKPRTQVFLEGGIKGFIANDRAELASELARFASLVRFNRVLTDRHPDIAEPMVQQYLTAAETNIYSVSGFVSAGGEIVARAARKVLQRPRKVGIGLCFEGRAVEEDVLEKLRALCKLVGYIGAFESEFIVVEGLDGEPPRRLLIDFNPRFYSQMGFDIARGLPLPMLVLEGASSRPLEESSGGTADSVEVSTLLARARAWRATGDEAYCHKTMLDLVLTLQGISGRMSRSDVRHWRRWHRDHLVTDAVRDGDDRVPAVIDTAQWLKHFARYPRSFVRSYVLNT